MINIDSEKEKRNHWEKTQRKKRQTHIYYLLTHLFSRKGKNLITFVYKYHSKKNFYICIEAISSNQGTYNDKKDTHSEYESKAFQKAKSANGIPSSKQPVNNGQPEKIKDTNNPGKFLCQYEFISD
jgi:hypothetical protein